MLSPYSKIPQAGRRDWAGDLTAVLHHLITAVALLFAIDIFLTIAIIVLVVR